MFNPLEFLKGVFSTATQVAQGAGEVAGEVTKGAGEVAQGVGETVGNVLKGGVSVTVGQASKIPLPDIGEIASNVASGAGAATKAISTGLANSTPRNIDTYSDIDKMTNSSIELNHKIANEIDIKPKNISLPQEQPINSLKSVKKIKGYVSKEDVNDLNTKAQSWEPTPAQILYGPREKTQKEIEKEKSYPKYIEDFTPSQLLYADKEIIRRAEQASSGRNGNKHAWLEDINHTKTNTSPVLSTMNNASEALNAGAPNNISIKPKAIKLKFNGHEEELAAIKKILQQCPGLDKEIQGMLYVLELVDFKKPECIKAFLEFISKDSRTKKIFKEAFKLYIKLTPINILANLVGKYYNETCNWLGQKFLGEDAAGMLDISHPNINDPSYIKDAIKFDNYKDKRLLEYQSYLKEKLESQFTNYNIDTIQGYYFPPNSEPSQRILQDKYFKEFLRNNKQKILNSKEKLTIDFESGNMYYAHHLADVLVKREESEKFIRLIIADTNDYNPSEEPKLIQAGGIAMKKGELIPLFILKEVLISRAELNTI